MWLFPLSQAGLRAVHDLGPEIRRAISGNLEEEDFPERDLEEPSHRVKLHTLTWTLLPHDDFTPSLLQSASVLQFLVACSIVAFVVRYIYILGDKESDIRTTNVFGI